MKIFKLKHDITLILIILIIVIISYLNFIFYGGFGSGDDISLLLSVTNSNLGDLIKSSLVGDHADRPLSMLLIDLTYYFYEDNVRLYIISSILTWLFAVYFLSFVLLQFLNKKTVYIFLLISPFPFFASSVFAGPYMFTQYFASILFWSISLFFLVQYAKSKIIFTYFIGLFFLILSLITLEYIIPLLLLTIFFHIFYEISKINIINKKLLIKFFLLYFLPVIIISLFYLIFKIYIVKLYANYDIVYGVSALNLKSVLQAIYYFVAIFVEIPLLLLGSFPYIFKYKLFFLPLALLIFFFFLINNNLNDQNNIQNKYISNKVNGFFLFILILSLLLSTIIFFISAYPSSTFGYYNRMMIPGFISLTILVSIFLNRINRKRYLIIPVFLTLFWIFSMFIQLDNLIKSWEIRNEAIEDISTKLNKTKINDNFILIANVPFFLKDNYNNEIVFFTTWNFEAHLNLVSGLNVSIWPISHRILTDPMFYPNHNILNKLSFISDENNIYYYQIEEDDDESIFEYLGNKYDMLIKFESIKSEKINNHPIILREKIRLRLIKLIKDNFNIR